jgi:ribosomal protein S27E
MKLNCLSCGHILDLHGDYDDYEGMVKCYVCGTLLMLRTERGNIKRVTFATRAPEEEDADSRMHSMSS